MEKTVGLANLPIYWWELYLKSQITKMEQYKWDNLYAIDKKVSWVDGRWLQSITITGHYISEQEHCGKREVTLVWQDQSPIMSKGRDRKQESVQCAKHKIIVRDCTVCANLSFCQAQKCEKGCVFKHITQLAKPAQQKTVTVCETMKTSVRPAGENLSVGSQ